MHFTRSSQHPGLRRVTGPGFRTDADGNIRIAPDWPALLSRLRRFDRIVVQTRNTAVRLVTMAPFPALHWPPGGECAYDDEDTLLLNPTRWRRASARLAHCSCCGSPGKLRVLDDDGAECLQLCAHPDIEPSDWAGYLAPFAAPPDSTACPPPRDRFHAGSPFAILDGAARHDPGRLPELLDVFAREAAAFACTLHSPAATQRRRIVPRLLDCRHGLLTASDGVHTLQIILPAVRHLAVSGGCGQPLLHLVGTDGASLLSLHADGTADGARAWSSLLRATLPRT